jgi:hypothetical protein
VDSLRAAKDEEIANRVVWSSKTKGGGWRGSFSPAAA